MDEFDMDLGLNDGPQSEWDRLSSEERRELLRNVFDDTEWYDGSPFHEGGAYHPALGEIASKLGAGERDIKMYYAAWLKAKGFTVEQIKEAITNAPKTNSFSGVHQTVSQIPEAVAVEPSTAYAQQMDKMQSEAFADPSLESGAYSVGGMAAPKTTSGDAVSDSMGSMMQFMMMQQQIAARQQHQQQMMLMEQRRLDQGRESELRREQQARDQQFSMQQMGFMREMLKNKDSDGFFDGDMKAIFKTKMVEQLLDGGSNNDSALERIAGKLLNPEILSAVATGASAAMSRSAPAKPAGYDSPTYDPYANQQPEVLPPSIPMTAQPVQQPMPTPGPDMFFGDEGMDEVQNDSAELIEAQPSSDEFKQAIIGSLKTQMGPELDDPKTLAAVQEQVNIAVDTVLIESSKLSAEDKLNEMTKKVILIRNLRDIAQGLEAAKTELGKGTSPDAVYGYIIGQLKQNPVFWDIFTTHSYDELLTTIHPFVDTGGVRFDYGFLQQPDSVQICTELIARMTAQA